MCFCLDVSPRPCRRRCGRDLEQPRGERGRPRLPRPQRTRREGFGGRRRRLASPVRIARLDGLSHGDSHGVLTNCTWPWQEKGSSSKAAFPFGSSPVVCFVPLFIAATAGVPSPTPPCPAGVEEPSHTSSPPPLFDLSDAKHLFMPACVGAVCITSPLPPPGRLLRFYRLPGGLFKTAQGSLCSVQHY